MENNVRKVLLQLVLLTLAIQVDMSATNTTSARHLQPRPTLICELQSITVRAYRTSQLTRERAAYDPLLRRCSGVANKQTTNVRGKP